MSVICCCLELALAPAIRLCERVCPSAVQVHVYVAWLARGDSTTKQQRTPKFQLHPILEPRVAVGRPVCKLILLAKTVWPDGRNII
jgi:hypothetical protein